jgi:universal stress protein E
MEEHRIMAHFRRILVAVKDPFARSLPGVAKAAQLAQASGASLELFHALTTAIHIDAFARPSLTPARFIEGERSRHQRRLEKIAASLSRNGVDATASVTVDFPPFEAIIRRAGRSGADLVVADCHAGRHVVPWLLQLTDWELLRHSAAPVLLVKSARRYRRPVVLAAVDPLHAFAKPGSLDKIILNSGLALKDALHGTLHAVHAYRPFPAAALSSGVMAPEITTQMMRRAESAARKEFRKLLRGSGIPPGRQHLVGQDPFAAIRNVARNTRADIVVIGAIARSGIKRLLIGNTAERILDGLACDALIVKPRGFVTRVSRARRGSRYVAPSLPILS